MLIVWEHITRKARITYNTSRTAEFFIIPDCPQELIEILGFKNVLDRLFLICPLLLSGRRVIRPSSVILDLPGSCQDS